MLLHLSEDQQFFRETTDRFLTEQVPPDTLRQTPSRPGRAMTPPTGAVAPSWGGPHSW